MSPHPTALLGLVLCLAQTIHMQEGALPRPSISAEPGTVIPRGSPVTFVCRGPAGVDTFRLEWENRSMFNDAKHVSQLSASESEARFCTDSVSEDSAGRYHCLYHKASRWSQPSEQLELVVKGTPGSASFPPYPPPSPHSDSPSPRSPSWCTEPSSSADAPAPQGLKAEHLYILITVSVVFLFCLFLMVLFFLHRQNQIKQGPPRSKDEEQKPQQRPNLAIDVLERKADMATVDALPEKDRETNMSAPTAEGPQEVTYAQLDQRALTHRTAQAVSPQSTEPLAETSTYAAIVKR
ncbi:leukocyte-associated immunoglobulin-like receptor 1 isoform X2 [Cebus imitator]|uniref:leukocyte-associated immunoglobulin-like receptor 1 isoform X2 n=1 Tax=Cebus imitator TaxID=2715852 RepID=UPI0018972161|nr:leukocyte-associated immunoglobulin-like receptor 1 isoform X2 [Cebus imitator]